MEELNLDNILDSEAIDTLFVDEETQETPTEEQENKKEKEETTEVLDVDDLFTDKPEGVGSEEKEEEDNEIEEQEDTNDVKDKGTSPKNNFYSSIAKALKAEGIFPDLDDDIIEEATTAETFRDIVNEQIKAGIEERQRRIDEALNAGVESSEIRRYENALNYLNSISEDNINDEGDKGETLRKQLIFQDFINRGYTKERAEREVNKSFNAGSDIEDAKEALASNKEFFEDTYNNLIKEAQEENNRLKKEEEEQALKLRKSLLEDKVVFGDVPLDKTLRQKAYESVSKPIYKDPNTGEILTAVQKYEKENRVDFLKNLGLLFTLTDGFKNIDKLVKSKVRKEVKKGLKELETTFNNTARTIDGNLKFISGVDDDPESNVRSWDLDV